MPQLRLFLGRYVKPYVSTHIYISSSKLGIRRVAQQDGYRIEFKPGSSVYMQIDGEALKAVEAKSVEVSFGYRINLLRAPHARANSTPASEEVEITPQEPAATKLEAEDDETIVDSDDEEIEILSPADS